MKNSMMLNGQARARCTRRLCTRGRTLVITNSANRLKYANLVYEANEDWKDMNSLAERFGAEYLLIPTRRFPPAYPPEHPHSPASSRIRGADRNTLGLRQAGEKSSPHLETCPPWFCWTPAKGRCCCWVTSAFCPPAGATLPTSRSGRDWRSI